MVVCKIWFLVGFVRYTYGNIWGKSDGFIRFYLFYENETSTLNPNIFGTEHMKNLNKHSSDRAKIKLQYSITTCSKFGSTSFTNDFKAVKILKKSHGTHTF